jgi:hypothetical protein
MVQDASNGAHVPDFISKVAIEHAAPPYPPSFT